MDVTYLGENSIRVKGKTASIIIDPSPAVGKTETDAIALTDVILSPNLAKIEGYRIVINGPGEYEVSGVKISGIKVEYKLVLRMEVDGVKVMVGDGLSVEKIHEKIEECDIAVINSENEYNYSILASLEPKALLVFGSKKENVAKFLGKEAGVKTTKYSATSEKLPQEMEFVVLG